MRFALENVGKPRLRLTVAYAGILMLVLGAFSVIVYVLLSLIVRQDIEPFRDDPGIVAAANSMLHRDALLLLAANAGAVILVVAAAFVLAKVTLRPLERAITLQRQFTNDASHDLRTPLAVIRTETSATLHRGDFSDSVDLRERLRIIDHQAQRMERMIDQLLTLAHLDADSALDREPIDLLTVSNAVVRDVRPLAEARGIDLRATRSESAIILGDELKLSQLVTNLVENALRHGPAHDRVAVSVWTSNGTACLSVRDGGRGIPEHERQNIFVRFHNAGPQSGDGRANHGLGLPLCRWIARAHGGDVFVESREGGGTTFTLKLPVLA
ncbi:MAG: HAMP domain-containing histidine kinase [Candidatus Eremiobacteraeota bacterium]|nr:HAMP domain-containing histidine kinase [Candidatus Eremiobacteraeota bacterium]MBC5827815.1 HAMP domain-containing histidine kinase [Candidatus Eremiobacteraeota bacterium]